MTGPGFGGGRGEVDALTQKDIDQLLQGAGSAPPGRARKTSVEVIPYNFLRPPRISKDRRVQLESIFARFALAMQSMLSSRLRTPMDVSCSVEQATFSEYVLSIANPCAAFTFSLGGVEGGLGALDLSTDLAFFIVDRSFGGPGEVSRMERGLTALERSVARGYVDKMLVLFREAWQDHIPFTPEIVGFESTPDMLQIVSHEDNVLVANLEVRAGQFSTLVALCIPLLALESFLGDKTAGRAPARHTATQAQRGVVEGVIREAQVDLVVRFPLIRLSAREVASLRVGQIIQTTQPTDGPIELHVNGARRFLGQLGQYRRMLGLRITDAVSPVPATPTRAARGRIS
ncbi:MAG: flagellar motor switch protein FliM [Gemmatimonadetes bacterium]|nr:flagellar motor switch protein FliM [Gemmatimonadota bacterium]